MQVYYTNVILLTTSPIDYNFMKKKKEEKSEVKLSVVLQRVYRQYKSVIISQVYVRI